MSSKDLDRIVPCLGVNSDLAENSGEAGSSGAQAMSEVERLEETLERAEHGRRNSLACGNPYEADIFGRLASIIRRRLAN